MTRIENTSILSYILSNVYKTNSPMNEVDTPSCLLSPRKLIDNIFLIAFESIHNQVIIRDQFFLL